jgi:hypothetical protein
MGDSATRLDLTDLTLNFSPPGNPRDKITPVAIAATYPP